METSGCPSPSGDDLLFNLFLIHLLLCFYFLLQLLDHPLQRFKFLFTETFSQAQFQSLGWQEHLSWSHRPGVRVHWLHPQGTRAGWGRVIGRSPWESKNCGMPLRHRSPVPIPNLCLQKEDDQKFIFKDLCFAAVGTLQSWGQAFQFGSV